MVCKTADFGISQSNFSTLSDHNCGQNCGHPFLVSLVSDQIIPSTLIKTLSFALGVSIECNIPNLRYLQKFVDVGVDIADGSTNDKVYRVKRY